MIMSESMSFCRFDILRVSKSKSTTKVDRDLLYVKGITYNLNRIFTKYNMQVIFTTDKKIENILLQTRKI